MTIFKKNKKVSNLVNLSLIGLFLLTAGFGCKAPNAEVQKYMSEKTITYWRVWDEADSFDEIIAKYKEMHPNITIDYRKFRYEEYETELINALAEDRGPDIFSIPESWIRKYQTKIEPMPASLTMAYQTTRGTIKKEVVVTLKTANTPTARQIKNDFADTVYKDVSIDGKIYGLPLSLDTLIMFYNKDLLNRSSVAVIPTSWDDFQKAIQKIDRYDSKGEITQSGTALGTANNIERNFDILSAIMMQNGATMINETGGLSLFNHDSSGYNPGAEAVNFYIDFANPVKNVYSWNDDMPNSIEAFYAGRVGMVFGYNYHIPTIRAKAPRLNFGIAPIPQVKPDQPVNYANYWIETVSKKSTNQDIAWDFIIFATQKDQARSFLTKTGRPTALKSLINEQIENEDLNAAATQILTGTNWYTGYDALAAEEAFRSMIKQIPTAVNDRDYQTIISTTISRITQTMQPVTP